MTESEDLPSHIMTCEAVKEFMKFTSIPPFFYSSADTETLNDDAMIDERLPQEKRILPEEEK